MCTPYNRMLAKISLAPPFMTPSPRLEPAASSQQRRASSVEPAAGRNPRRGLLHGWLGIENGVALLPLVLNGIVVAGDQVHQGRCLSMCMWGPMVLVSFGRQVRRRSSKDLPDLARIVFLLLDLRRDEVGGVAVPVRHDHLAKLVESCVAKVCEPWLDMEHEYGVWTI